MYTQTQYCWGKDYTKLRERDRINRPENKGIRDLNVRIRNHGWSKKVSPYHQYVLGLEVSQESS